MEVRFPPLHTHARVSAHVHTHTPPEADFEASLSRLVSSVDAHASVRLAPSASLPVQSGEASASAASESAESAECTASSHPQPHSPPAEVHT